MCSRFRKLPRRRRRRPRWSPKQFNETKTRGTVKLNDSWRLGWHFFFADGRIAESPAVAFIRLSGFCLSLSPFWGTFQGCQQSTERRRAYQHDSLQLLARFNTLKWSFKHSFEQEASCEWMLVSMWTFERSVAVFAQFISCLIMLIDGTFDDVSMKVGNELLYTLLLSIFIKQLNEDKWRIWSANTWNRKISLNNIWWFRQKNVVSNYLCKYARLQLSWSDFFFVLSRPKREPSGLRSEVLRISSRDDTKSPR